MPLIEILLIAATVVAMAKMADIENRSPLAWGGLALLIESA
jgi:hypothetical protein